VRRPIDVAFGAEGDLYVLDFGQFEMSETGVDAQAGTGRVWRCAAWSEDEAD